MALKGITFDGTSLGLKDEEARQSVATLETTVSGLSSSVSTLGTTVGDLSSSVDTLENDVDDLSTAVDSTSDSFDEYSVTMFGTHRISKDDLESGTWAYSNKSNSSTRLRTKELYPVRPGMRISVDTKTRRVYLGILDTKTSTMYSGGSGWLEAYGNYMYTVLRSGYMVIIIEGDSSITVDNFNCAIEIMGLISADIRSSEYAARNVSKVLATTLCGGTWRNQTILVGTGTSHTSTGCIRSPLHLGYPDGVSKITSDDGYIMYIAAYDSEDCYAGLYKKSGIFDKDDTDFSTYNLVNTFDCTLFPEYRFMVICRHAGQLTDIDSAESVHIHYWAMDNTLTEPYMAAEAKTVGDKFENLTSSLKEQMIGHTTNQEIGASDFEQGGYAFSTKTDSTTRLRNKNLIPVHVGEVLHYTNPTKRLYIGILETPTGTAYIGGSGWIEAGGSDASYTITKDGYMVLLIEDANGITVDDYDCDISMTYDFITPSIKDFINTREMEINECNEKLFMIFQKVGVLGDSLSVGFNQAVYDESRGVRALPYSWVKQIGRDAGVPWLNLGQSGFTTLTWCSDETYGKVQMEAEGNKCQAYVIGLGVNDEWETYRQVDLGTTEDIVDDPDTVATTFYGGYNRIIQLLKRRNPKCKIFCLTSPIMVGTDYNNAVRYICTEHYTVENNVFLTDLYPYRRFFSDNDYGIYPDKIGVHFTPIGYRMIANVIEKAINNVMRENQLCFQDVATIPYDTGAPTANTMTE